MPSHPMPILPSQAAELEPDMAKWTPRARPKDAPKQSARYQTDFKVQAPIGTHEGPGDPPWP